jgi:hypothetical protein
MLYGVMPPLTAHRAGRAIKAKLEPEQREALKSVKGLPLFDK